jgi:hypothetical protein
LKLSIICLQFPADRRADWSADPLFGQLPETLEADQRGRLRGTIQWFSSQREHLVRAVASATTTTTTTTTNTEEEGRLEVVCNCAFELAIELAMLEKQVLYKKLIYSSNRHPLSLLSDTN